MDHLFKALSDPIRLRILGHLNRPEAECCSDDDRVCACDLEPLVGLSQPTVSHHMRLLVQAGLVQSEKVGRWVYYRINRPRFAEAMAWLATFASSEALILSSYSPPPKADAIPQTGAVQ